MLSFLTFKKKTFAHANLAFHVILFSFLHMRIHLLISILALSYITACSKSIEDTQETRFMMGTLVSFTIVNIDPKQAKQAIRLAADEMQRIENTFTIYGDANNDVKAFNQSPVNQPYPLNSEVAKLLSIAMHVQQQSHGGFSPTLASLNKLWGFSQAIPPTSPPSLKAIAEHLQGTQDCLIQKEHLWVRTSPNCQLDFGAIAKGYAIDRGIEILKQHGIQHAMIDAGGDIRIIGQHASHPWRIGIRDPRHHDRILGILSLQGDASVVTSGDYERFYIYQGKRYHHILNPKNGMPSQNNQSVTVIASNAMLADAWSTALFVSNKKDLSLAESNHIQAFIINHEGMQQQSKGMPLSLPTSQ